MMSTMEEEPAMKIRRELEEGELSDSDGEVYNPLPRPDNLIHFNPVSIMSMNIRDDVSSESEQEPSSENDSDSDNPSCLYRAKKPKIKIKKRKRAGSMQSTTKDKYKIWCKTAGEDTLTEDLVGCDVAKNKVQYGIESYTLPERNGFHHSNTETHSDKEMAIDQHSSHPHSRKRNHSNRNDFKININRKFRHDSNEDKGEARYIPDLTVNVDSPDEEIALEVAEKLNETKIDLILNMVKILGKEKLIELFKETKRIEENGGMMVMNGTRRRTPGGVLIFLLKRDSDISEDKMKELFNEEKMKQKSQRKNRDHEVEQLKQSLTDGGLPTLRSRAEQWAAKNSETQNDSNVVSNPPPSPVTDGRDCSSDADPNHFSAQALANESDTDFDNNSRVNHSVLINNLPLDPRSTTQTSYDDDCIDISCNDDMELF